MLPPGAAEIERQKSSHSNSKKQERDPNSDNEAVQAYKKIFLRSPNREDAALIAEKVTDLDIWQEKVLNVWKAHSKWNKTNIAAMLDRYQQAIEERQNVELKRLVKKIELEIYHANMSATERLTWLDGIRDSKRQLKSIERWQIERQRFQQAA